ncbi:MAG: 2Fe-2S iron-sulfur cluster-binding protein [Arenicella sp.]|jgi:2Fe-2S ferredoxin|nr:2Fe-2S iron-sulfur cluster-binding protein [Arenicella sp.]HAU68051.1 2Fe-2S ferredoxin [Gammaproteobacteria bacterium]
MAKVIFIDYQGEEREVDATNGDSLMEAATNNDIPGIDADCGGACACATCHVYIDQDWTAVVGSPADLEAEMLEVAEDVKDNSRLACQVKVSDEMDGLRVITPESQF